MSIKPPKIPVSNSSLDKLVRFEKIDWEKIKRNKWWLSFISVFLIVFIIWRCQILMGFYKLTGINLVSYCAGSQAFRLSDLVGNLKNNGAPDNVVVSNPDGSMSTVSTDVNGNIIINNLPTPFLSGPTGVPGVDGIDGFGGGGVGPAGPAGPQGSSGAQGNSGSNGTNGTNGSAGAAGAVGPMGPPGLPAPVPGVPCVAGEYLQWNGVAFVCVVTTNTLVNDGVNTFTSTVNGVADSDPIISTNSLTTDGVNLTSTVNGVAGSVALTTLFSNPSGGDLTNPGGELTITGGVGAVLGAGTTVGLTPCLAGEAYVHDGIAWVCTNALPYTFQNGLTESPAGVVEFGGANPLLHDTTLTQAGFDLDFTGGSFYHDTIGTTSGIEHGLQSGDDILSIAGFDGTVMYSSSNPLLIPGGGEGSYAYTTSGQSGIGVQDGISNDAGANFNAGSYNIYSSDALSNSTNIGGSSSILTMAANDASGAFTAQSLGNTPGEYYLYTQSGVGAELGSFDINSAAGTTSLYQQDSLSAIARMDYNLGAGTTSFYNQDNLGNQASYIIDVDDGLIYNSSIPPGFAPNKFQVNTFGDVIFDRALMPGNDAGLANELLISQGVGLPPVWTDPATFIGGYAITSINGETGPAITVNSTDYITTTTTPNTVTMSITPCAAGENYVYNGIAWVCQTASTLLTTQNGISTVGTAIELGLNPLLHDTDIPSGGFNLTFDGAGAGGQFAVGGAPALGKVATFYGDVNITGVIDPTAILFSDQTPSSYNPATTNGFKIGNTGGFNRPIYVSNFADTSDTFQVRRADDTTVVMDVDAFNQSVGVRGQASTYALTVHDTSTAGILLSGTDMLQNFSRTATGSVFSMRNNGAAIMHLNANNGASLAFAAVTGGSTTETQMVLDTNGNLLLGSLSSLPNATAPRQIIRNWNGSTNSILTTLELHRDVTGFGAGASGIGTSLDFRTKADDGNTGISGRVISAFEDASAIGFDDPEGSIRLNVSVNGVDTEGFRLISGNISGAGTTTSVGLGVTNPLSRLHLGAGTVGVAGNDGFGLDGLVDGVLTTPALSTADNFRMYYEDTDDTVYCSTNGGAYTACFGAGFPLTSANNGLSVSGTIVQLGGPLIQDTTITNNGFEFIIDGTVPPPSGKALTVLGDMNVTGVIDPTALLFSVQTPSSYDPNVGVGSAGYRIGITSAGTQLPIFVSPQANSTDIFQIRNLAGTPFFDADSTNQRIGIKTVAPADAFEVNDGNIRFTDNTNATGTTGVFNYGANRFFHIGGGTTNAYLGINAGNFASTGFHNTGIGNSTLTAISSGTANVAIGSLALSSNATGRQNVAIGIAAMDSYNGAGAEDGNTAIGTGAMDFLDGIGTDDRNVAIGSFAMRAVTEAIDSVAIGNMAMGNASSTSLDIAIGTRALDIQTTGSGNIAIGDHSMTESTTGSNNLMIGNNTFRDGGVVGQVGSSNVGVGHGALRYVNGGAANFNVAFGNNAGNTITSGSSNTLIGYDSDTGGAALTNATALGARSQVNCSNCLVLGSVTGVNGATSNTMVGIGTNTPIEQLHLVGTGTGTFDGTNGIRLSQPDVTTVWETRNGYVGNIISPGVRFGNVTDTTLAFMTNDTIRMTIGNSTDAISMGGAVPVTNLTVADLDDSTSVLKLSNIGTANTLSDGFDLISNSTTGQFVNNDAGGFEWHTNAVGIPSGASLRMDMDQFGHLDLNPDIPGGATAYTALNVFETITTATQTQPVRGIDVSFNDGGFGATNTNMGLRVDMSGLTGGTNYSGIFLNGNFGIGTSTPSTMLHVGNTSVVDGTSLLSLQDVDSTCTQNANSGGVACGSDITLKKNITDLEGSLERLLQVKTVSYNWKTDADGTNKQDGFIAQNVEDIFPGLVTEGEWIDGSTRKFLTMGGFMPYVVKGIQEQQTQITTLRLDVDGLIGNKDEVIADSPSATPTPEETNGLLTLIKNAINDFFDSVSVAFNKTATFLSGAVFKGEVKFANNSAGYAIIVAGQNSVEVKFTKQFSNVPVINASPNTPILYAIDNETNDGFTISIDKPSSKDIKFSWSAIIVDDAQTTKSENATPESTVIPEINGVSISPSPSEAVTVNQTQIVENIQPPVTQVISPTQTPGTSPSTESLEMSPTTATVNE